MMTEGIAVVSVEELIPGMIISKDITRNSTVLLKEGSIVNEEIKDRLKNIYLIDSVEVYIPASITGESSKEVALKKVEEVFQEVADKLQELFSKMNMLDENNIGDLREFAWKIENQLKNSELALTSVFKGDNEDCIYKHGVNVAVLSAMLGKWLGIEQEKIRLLIYAAMLHDFGMTKLSEELQNQPDLITDKKNNEVKKHVKIAYDAVKSFKYLDKSVAYAVLMHHERCDGSGYPLAVTGDKIHAFAKIIAIADEFDVLNSNRSLMDEYGVFYSLKIIKEKSLKYLDYQYAKVFLEHICNFYTGDEVRLSNGDVAKILQINVEDIEKPLLLKDDEFIDLKKNKDIFIKEIIVK